MNSDLSSPTRNPRSVSRQAIKWQRVNTMLAFILLAGCVQDSYHYGISRPERIPYLPRTPNLISVGGHHPNVDRVERVVKFPGEKFREWFPSDEPDATLPLETKQLKTVQKASDYLDTNGLKGVYIDIREYNPREQWNRLKDNERVSPFWKYTGGTLYHIGYCVLPGRAFGYDIYNPYTNTLSINSVSPPRSVFQAGYVKKIYEQKYPGTYVATNWLPILPLVRDTAISNDVLTYARATQDWELERGLYPQVYGRLGSDAVSQATSWIPGMAYMPFYTAPLLQGAGRVTGTLTGKAVAEKQAP
ncbi:MAG: hypothetical protein ABL921_28270, partial [Pirellula sp.]